MIRYAVVIEKAKDNYSAYVPDLPGCVAAGNTVDEVERQIRSAIKLHVEELRRSGEELPAPTTTCQYVEA